VNERLNERLNVPSIEGILRDAVASVDTLPPPLEAFRERAAHEQRRRRRRRTTLGAAAAAVLVLLVSATWLGTRSDGDTSARPRPVVTMVENPADIAWWADGSLHLANVTVEVPPSGRPPDQLAQINGGAVYGDDTGAIAFVGDDGEVIRIGTKTAGAPLVASDENGWVAWVDPRDGSPELVVYDLTARGVLASRPLPAAGTRRDGAVVGSNPIALDGDKVFYAAGDGEHAWTVPGGATEPVEPSGLLAAASGTRVWQVDPTTITMVQPFFSVSFDRAGSGAQISPDGNRVLTRTSGRGGAADAVHLYDTRSGEPLWTGLTGRDAPIAATLGPETEVTYLLAYRDDESRRDAFVRQSSSSPVELRTCDHEARRCRTVAQIPLVGAAPVLAR
jgi:hypothetical protein